MYPMKRNSGTAMKMKLPVNNIVEKTTKFKEAGPVKK